MSYSRENAPRWRARERLRSPSALQVHGLEPMLSMTRKKSQSILNCPRIAIPTTDFRLGHSGRRALRLRNHRPDRSAQPRCRKRCQLNQAGIGHGFPAALFVRTLRPPGGRVLLRSWGPVPADKRLHKEARDRRDLNRRLHRSRLLAKNIDITSGPPTVSPRLRVAPGSCSTSREAHRGDQPLCTSLKRRAVVCLRSSPCRHRMPNQGMRYRLPFQLQTDTRSRTSPQRRRT